MLRLSPTCIDVLIALKSLKDEDRVSGMAASRAGEDDLIHRNFWPVFLDGATENKRHRQMTPSFAAKVVDQF